MRKMGTTLPLVMGLSVAAALFLASCTQKDEKGQTQKLAADDPTAPLVTVGAPTDGLADAVAKNDLTSPAVLSGMPARLRELAKAGKEPRAAGVMLRALTVAKKDDAAALSCELLDTLPQIKPYDTPESRAFVDAALLSIAHGKGACAPKVVTRLGQDKCLPLFRCKDGKKLARGATTDQKEPLCSADDLAREVEDELARPKADVLVDKDAYYTERWALAALRALNAVPPEFEKAHARRQYALTQVATPECGMGIDIGKPCHTDEAAIRDQACRNETSPVSFSFTRFEVSDDKKTISNVVEGSPP
jgi:hypothetical protein